MTWTYVGGGTNERGISNATNLIVTPNKHVNTGDLICVAFTNASGGASFISLTDSLGNGYAQKSTTSIWDSTNGQAVGAAFAISSSAGTPVVTLKYFPTPGTSQENYTTVNVDIFTGSDSNSTWDGTGNASKLTTPGTGTNAVASAKWTTSTNNDLLYTVCVSTSNVNLSDSAPGTSFTTCQKGGGTDVVLYSAYSAAGAANSNTSGWWTTTSNVAHCVSAFAITPAAGTTVALTGTVTSATESDIVTGGKTIILTVTGDTWVAAGATFDAQRQNIINGLTSAGAEAHGWNNEVKAKIGVTDVTQNSSTVVTITLDAEAAYDITANETITVTVPSTALTGGVAVVASPTFTITANAAPGVASGYYNRLLQWMEAT